MAKANAIIDLQAIAMNIQLVKFRSNADFLTAVKADAYGHGLIEVAKTAKKSGAEWLGTALLEEAITLREDRLSGPIIAWLVTSGEDSKRANELDIDLSFSSIEVLSDILDAAKFPRKKRRLHLEIYTGMT